LLERRRVPDELSRPVLLYDADCRLCRFVARVVLRLDRHDELGLLPLHDDDAAELLVDVSERVRPETWRLVAKGEDVGYGRGAVELLRAMRLTRPAARMLAALPPSLLDRLYVVVARNRRRLGRLVPDGPAPRRYP